MRSLGDVPSGSFPAARTGRRYRRDARFVFDLAAVSTPLNRNQQAPLLHRVDSLERLMNSKGRKSGVLGLTGLAMLRAVVFGLCCPSIQAIRERTGFCKQTVVKTIRALEARVVRRHVRRPVMRNSMAMANHPTEETLAKLEPRRSLSGAPT